MLIVKVMGGLGNQMQQYALYTKLLTLGKDVKLDLSWFDGDIQKDMLAKRELELSYFEGLPVRAASSKEIAEMRGSDTAFGKLIRKIKGSRVFCESEMYHPEIFGMDDREIEGYFACTKYYDDILPKLRELFVFPESTDREAGIRNKAVMEDMKGNEYSAAVHIRRGDYLDKENAAILGGICTPDYYEGAMKEVESAADNKGCGDRIHFYVFSDDIEFAKTCQYGTRREKVTFCDWNKGKNSLLDIQLMTKCDALIAANSTFSFWGGRLNDKADLLIRPLYHRNNQRPDPVLMHDYWKGWTLIDRDGRVYKF